MSQHTSNRQSEPNPTRKPNDSPNRGQADPTEADDARVRMDAEADAKAAARRRDERRRQDMNEPKATQQGRDGEEPIDTQVAKTWAREMCIRDRWIGLVDLARLLDECEESEEFVPAPRALEDSREVDEADPPLTDRQGHRGGHA